MTRQESCLERLFPALCGWLSKNRLPFLSSMIFGLLAHAFVILNKIPNHDDVSYLFGKGETVLSGRWGLELLRAVIPDLSMPWLHGIVSLLLLSCAVCLIVDMFEWKNPLSIVLLSGLVMVFPSQTGTFCYMFTSSAYAVAFFLSVLAVREAKRAALKDGKGRLSALLSVLFLILMFSIYQAYISISSSLMILLLVAELLQAEDRAAVLKVFKRGLLFVAILLAALELYRLTITVSLIPYGGAVNQYSNEAKYMAPKFPEAIAVAYRFFFYNISSRYNMIITSRFSRVLHVFGLCLGLAGVASNLLRSHSLPKALLMLFCLAVLPFSVCVLYAAFYWNTIHTLVLYSYATLYLFMLLGIEELPGKLRPAGKDLLSLTLILIIGINTCFANRTYLKLHLEYENAYSLATTLMAQIRSLPDYSSDVPIAIYPSGGDALSFASEFGTEDENRHDIMGAQFQLLTGYTEADFVRYYLGQELPFLDHDEASVLYEDERVQAMPVYPDYGSVAMIDGVIFVKTA